MKKYLITIVLIFTCYFYANAQWVKQNSGTTNSIYAVDFVDTEYGWACGYGGMILHTKNGGQTWTKQTSGVSSVNNIDFVNRNVGWGVGDGWVILHTTNGGATWTHDSIDQNGWYVDAICFPDEKHGWTGYGDILMQTNDGGETWFENDKKQHNGCTNCYLYNTDGIDAIHFIDSLTGVVVGSYGSPSYTMYTTNGGQDWTQGSFSINPCSTSLYDVLLVSPTVAYMTGSDSNWKTTNSCVNWYGANAKAGRNAVLRAVDAVNENTIYFVGDSGVITKSINGEPFYQMNSNTTSNLYDICIVDENNAWIVGRNGTILKNDWSLLGVETPKIDNTFSIFPNPLKTTAKVTFMEPISGVINMYNLMGVKVKSIEIEETKELEITRGNLPAGVYILSIQQEGRNAMLGKIIVTD